MVHGVWPGAARARSLRPLPPCRQCALSHDLHELLDKVAEGRMHAPKPVSSVSALEIPPTPVIPSERAQRARVEGPLP